MSLKCKFKKKNQLTRKHAFEFKVNKYCYVSHGIFILVVCCFILLVWLGLADGITGRENYCPFKDMSVLPCPLNSLRLPSSLSSCSFIKRATVQLLVSLTNVCSSETAGRMTLGTNMKNDGSQRRCKRLWLTLGSAQGGVTFHMAYSGLSRTAICAYMSFACFVSVNYIF